MKTILTVFIIFIYFLSSDLFAFKNNQINGSLIVPKTETSPKVSVPIPKPQPAPVKKPAPIKREPVSRKTPVEPQKIVPKPRPQPQKKPPTTKIPTAQPQRAYPEGNSAQVGTDKREREEKSKTFEEKYPETTKCSRLHLKIDVKNFKCECGNADISIFDEDFDNQCKLGLIRGACVKNGGKLLGKGSCDCNGKIISYYDSSYLTFKEQCDQANKFLEEAADLVANTLHKVNNIGNPEACHSPLLNTDKKEISLSAAGCGDFAFIEEYITEVHLSDRLSGQEQCPDSPYTSSPTNLYKGLVNYQYSPQRPDRAVDRMLQANLGDSLNLHQNTYNDSCRQAQVGTKLAKENINVAAFRANALARIKEAVITEQKQQYDKEGMIEMLFPASDPNSLCGLNSPDSKFPDFIKQKETKLDCQQKQAQALDGNDQKKEASDTLAYTLFLKKLELDILENEIHSLEKSIGSNRTGKENHITNQGSFPSGIDPKRDPTQRTQISRVQKEINYEEGKKVSNLAESTLTSKKNDFKKQYEIMKNLFPMFFGTEAKKISALDKLQELRPEYKNILPEDIMKKLKNDKLSATALIDYSKTNFKKQLCNDLDSRHNRIRILEEAANSLQDGNPNYSVSKLNEALKMTTSQAKNFMTDSSGHEKNLMVDLLQSSDCQIDRYLKNNESWERIEQHTMIGGAFILALASFQYEAVPLLFAGEAAFGLASAGRTSFTECRDDKTHVTNTTAGGSQKLLSCQEKPLEGIKEGISGGSRGNNCLSHIAWAVLPEIFFAGLGYPAIKAKQALAGEKAIAKTATNSTSNVSKKIDPQSVVHNNTLNKTGIGPKPSSISSNIRDAAESSNAPSLSLSSVKSKELPASPIKEPNISSSQNIRKPSSKVPINSLPKIRSPKAVASHEIFLHPEYQDIFKLTESLSGTDRDAIVKAIKELEESAKDFNLLTIDGSRIDRKKVAERFNDSWGACQ